MREHSVEKGEEKHEGPFVTVACLSVPSDLCPIQDICARYRSPGNKVVMGKELCDSDERISLIPPSNGMAVITRH